MRIQYLVTTIAIVCFAIVSPQVADAKKRRKAKKKKPAVAAVAEAPPAVEERQAPLPVDRSDRRSVPQLGLSIDLFTEFSHLNGRRVIDVAAMDESADYSSGPIALRGWVWLPWKKRFRLGGGAAFRSYSVDDNGEFSLGPLFDAYGQIDFRLPNYKKFEFALTGRAGLLMLIPSGDLSREIDRLQADDINVFGGPRLGWIAGGSFAGRYPISRKFTLLVDLGFDIGRLYIFRTKQTVDNLNFSKTWTGEIQRLTLSAGVEMTL